MSEESVPEVVPKSVPKREQALGDMENMEVPDLSKCPVPPPHVRSYEECCDKYARGEMTDLDVLGEVISTLKKLRSESHE